MKIRYNLNSTIKALLSCLFILSISNCSQTSSNQQSSELSQVPREVIYDAEIKESSIWFTVKSNGCTDVSKFRLEIKKMENVAWVSLVRLVPDYCKARSRLMVIDMEFEEINGKDTKVVFQNPFTKKFTGELKNNKKITNL